MRLRADSDFDSRLDQGNRVPNQRWPEKLQIAIEGCSRCLVFTGRVDPQRGVIGPWPNAELRALVNGHTPVPYDFNRRGPVFAG